MDVILPLQVALEELDIVELETIARLRRIMSARKPGFSKTALVALLTVALSRPGPLRVLVANLPDAARSALIALQRHGGSLPASLFFHRFGRYTPYRARRHRHAPPGHRARTTTTLLAWLGLIVVTPRHAPAATPIRVVIPVEILAALPPVPLPTPVLASDVQTGLVSSQSPIATRYSPVLLHDMGVLLSAVHRLAPSPMRGGGWPADFWRTLTPRLARPDPTAPAHERANPRLRLLHALACAADLVTEADCATLTPAAWEWLAQPSADQLRHLWHCWVAWDDPARWHRFGLPGASLPDPLACHRAPLAALPTCDPAQSYPVQGWLADLLRGQPTLWHLLPAWHDHNSSLYEEDQPTALTQALHTYLTETLVEWGLVTCPTPATFSLTPSVSPC